MQGLQANTSLADTEATPKDVPLCVDLDGTLVKSDLLIESTLLLLHRNPLYLFLLPLWLVGGRANLKRQVAIRTKVDPCLLPYRDEFVSWLREQAKSRDLVLCTAADAMLAESVAGHLGFFKRVMASDGITNLSGPRKAARLVEDYGEKGFDYAGNEHVDLKIWEKARQAVIVDAVPKLERHVRSRFDVCRSFPRRCPSFRTWSRSLRLHQWAKNLLVFLPILAAHRVLDIGELSRSVAAWIIFGLCASGVYVLNDLLDLSADRKHARKRDRPFASGILSLKHGLVANVVLTAVAFVSATMLSWQFALVLVAYWLLTNAYSLRLKRVVALDVIVLAGLYTVRILAGAAATHIAPSFWMLAFSMFLFLSLAVLKRYAELVGLRLAGLLTASGRGYHVDDLPMLASLGTASGLLAVLVLALYIRGENGAEMYHRPEILWLLCPLMLYWVLRVWFVAHRGAMHDDPVVFAATDWISRIVIALCAIVVSVAL
jgi:4-hydroxybenzoate polyprenyltransferase